MIFFKEINSPKKKKLRKLSAYVRTLHIHVFICLYYFRLVAEPDFTKCDVFLDQHLCWPWNKIVINQSDLKNQFIVFVKFSVWCLYISVVHLSFPLILGFTHG